MKNLYFLILICVLVGSCKKTSNFLSGKFEIPTLLDRPEKLQYFNEWSDVRNNYADLRHRIIKDPHSIDAMLRLANLYISEARITGEHGHYYNAALKTVNNALQLNNITSDQKFLALSAKASVQLSLHDFISALATAQKAILLNPYNAQIYGALVDAYVELGEYDKAVEHADKMISIRPDIRSYSRISYLREIHGMTDEAIEAMKLAVDAGSPGSEEKSWAALQLAQLCMRYNKIPEAESILHQILEDRPAYPFAKAALAELYRSQSKFADAEKELIEACNIIPEVGFYVQLAELYQYTGRKTEKETKLKEIFEMLKDDTEQGHNMSLEYAHLYLDFYDNADLALKYLQKDLIMRPENIDINRILSKIYLAKKDRSQAETHLAKAMKTNSKHPDIDQLQKQIQQI